MNVATSSAQMLRPPLKWAGGKRWLLPRLKPIWDAFAEHRLVEPFCGGLAVALGLNPAQALLNDINPHSINLYRWLKKGLTVSLDMRKEKSLYYEYRERFNHLSREGMGDSGESAQLFYYLNRTGYNGLCRFNSRGDFNVPFGQHKSILYVRDFEPYMSAFEQWHFNVGDFETLEISSSDFVYADPPYDVPFTKYSKEDFNWGDQVRLVKWLVSLPAPVVLSNQATPRIVELYGDYGFEMEFLDAPRSISRTGDRTPAKEVLATLRV